MPLQEGLEGGEQIMKRSNLLTQRRTVWTSVLLVMLVVASLTGATPGRLIPGSLAHANAQGISAPATNPKQEQEQSQQLEPGQPTTPLERVLNKDGTLKLSTSFSGSVDVDPKGWRMQTGPDGKPRFVKSDEQQQRQQRQQHLPAKPRSSPSSPSPLTAGDENWDDRFNTLGMNNSVHAIAISGSDVYVGGYFTTAGGVTAYNIAKWDGLGGQWSALGSGTDCVCDVSALAISGSDVYMGGLFFSAGGVTAYNIAKWNGSSWSALGSGVSNGGIAHVYAIAISGSDVYVGGNFTTAGGVPANGIAKWDGSSWSALGSGVNDQVSAIRISGSDVYVGGGFTTAGGVPANRIAKWDGSSWSALGSGVSGVSPRSYVNEIAISGSDVYASGTFTIAGGLPANYIAKWDGSSWSALGSGVNRYVKDIGINGSDVYVDGFFTTAGGVSANNIAKWNGSSWSALGSGLNGPSSPTAWAIAVSSSDVYVGGDFSTAGVNPSNRFGIWHMPPAANLVGHVSWAGSTQPNTRQMQPLTLTLCSTSGGSTSIYVANTNASGYFTVDVASLISGTYNWREKGSRSLANGGTLTLTGGNQQAEMGVQAGGDADNDNVVGASDFNVLRATFNSVSDLRADFNNDGVTGIQDFTILKVNFGLSGATVTCP